MYTLFGLGLILSQGMNGCHTKEHYAQKKSTSDIMLRRSNIEGVCLAVISIAIDMTL
jgi:hypothetical protein